MEVFLILDPAFRGDLRALSRRAHVWIIHSPENDAGVRAAWHRETDAPSLLHGVTAFDGGPDARETFHALLGTIDEHHGAFSVPRPWDAIHVVGLPMEAVQRERVVEELGGAEVDLVREGDGFAIRRVDRPGDRPDGLSRSG